MVLRCLSLLTCLLALNAPAAHSAGLQGPPTVAAASDLQFALEAIAKAFTAETGERVTLVFGSSGNLARQAMNGAPFDVFLSADESFVDMLAAESYARDRGTLYGIGRVVLFAPRGSPLAVDEQMDGLRALLARGQGFRFAVANPEHAPYGRAAEAALRARGLWDALQPALVLGENISQTAQFATSGAVGGILAYSLVLGPALKDRGTYALIPESLHPPLRQRMVLLKRAGPAAQRFYDYLQGPGARALFKQYGFALPD
jgi:molybdate transport system substrate-binding protein